MKKNRIILAIALIFLIGFGWLNQAKNVINKTKAYNAVIEEAELCCEKKLYQKAIGFYEEALNIKEDEFIRDKWLDAYGMALEAEEITCDQYLSAIRKVVEIYPQKTDVWEKLIMESINKMDFSSAWDDYKHAIKAGADKTTLSKYKNAIFYSVSENNKIFSAAFLSSQGYFTVFDGTKWGIMDTDGQWIYECVYDYVGPVINDDVYFLTTSKDSRVYNNSKVVQAILPDKDVTTKAVKEGIIPICREGIWSFYDYINEKNILNKYDDVSCFINEKVAVKEGSTWSIIDKGGKKVTDKNFDDIKMLETGEFAINGTMVASINGQYGIFDEAGNSKCDMAVADMDIYMGGSIAFKDSEGRWGFVNTDGKIVIDPKYDEAMSFSNGLAAIRLGDKWGFINEDEELVIDCKFSQGGYFNSNGICFVGLSNEQIYMISLRFKGAK